MPGRQEDSSFGCAATLGVRGFEFSVRADRRVRVLGAPRPWTSEGSSFPRRGPGGFKFSAILSPGALKGSCFRFPRRRRAACNSAEGFEFLAHRGRRVAEACTFLARERRRVPVVIQRSLWRPKGSHSLSSAETGTLRSLGGLRRKGRLENLNPSMEGETCEPFFLF